MRKCPAIASASVNKRGGGVTSEMMEQAIVFISAVLAAIQGAPPILYVKHETKEVGIQPPFTARLENEQETSAMSEYPTDLEECFMDACADVCKTVCCLSGMTTPILGGNFILDSVNCLKHTCEVTENGTRWWEGPMPCEPCASQMCTVNIPGQCCPHCISAEPGEWSEWSGCSATCGKGLQSSVRTCYDGETSPTSHCPQPTLRTRTCHAQCPVPCEWEWSDYSDCSKSCGGGFQVRHRNITQEAEYGGTPCPDRNLTESRECNTVTCPESCEWIWSEMSECTVTCGGGMQYRYPILSRAPSPGGEPCPHYIVTNKTERFQCNLHNCPVGCAWTWSDFTDCTLHCEDGQSRNRKRHPIIIQPPMNKGAPCPDFVERNETEELKCRDELCSQSRSCENGENVCNGECIVDKDQDCIPDYEDNCPELPMLQSDRDGDGVGDSCDNCIKDWNPHQEDIDRDRIGDACDNCMYDPNYKQENADGDAWGNACDRCPFTPSLSNQDQDRDGWGDICDNCIYLYNPGQEDRDNDFVGYNCEADKDGDGTINQLDNCLLLYNPDQADSEMDRIGDACQRTLPESAGLSDLFSGTR